MNLIDRKWIQVNTSECKWMQVNTSECKRMQVNASEYKWWQVNAGECKWMQEGASECKWIQVMTSECKWMQEDAQDGKWMQMNSCVEVLPFPTAHNVAAALDLYNFLKQKQDCSTLKSLPRLGTDVSWWKLLWSLKTKTFQFDSEFYFQ